MAFFLNNRAHHLPTKLGRDSTIFDKDAIAQNVLCWRLNRKKCCKINVRTTFL